MVVLKRLKAAGLRASRRCILRTLLNRQERCLSLLKNRPQGHGGSDFHGSIKPDIKIGVGRGDLRVPECLLKILREA